MLTPRQTITPESRLKAVFDQFDTGALLGEFAGLMTVPSNAAYGLRLGYMTELAAVAAEHGGRQPSNRDVERISNGDDVRTLAAMEDPAEFPFTEPVAFEGRAYAVFTGQGGDEAYRAERLFEAVLHLHATAPSAFSKEARDFIRAVLTFGDAVATRSGLRRGEPAPGRQGVIVPPQQLRSRVTWSSADLKELLDDLQVPNSTLDALRCMPGDGRDDIDPDNGTLSVRPLIELASGDVIVIVHHLLRAAAHRILVAADAAGLRSDVAEAYAAAAEASSDEALTRLAGFVPNSSFKTTKPQPPAVRLNVYEFEQDAIVIAATICDPLDDFDPAVSISDWRMPAAHTAAIADFVGEAVTWAKGSRAPDQAVLVLYVYSAPAGRSTLYSFPDYGSDVEHLAMSGAGLELAVALERDDPLAIVHFAISRRELHAATEVISFSTVDEFAAYHAHDRAFYFSDDPAPNLVVIESDFAKKDRQELLNSLDRQSAPLPFGPATKHVEVLKRFENEPAPIFFPRYPLPGPALVVRLPGADVWICGPPRTDIATDALGLYNDVLDAIAYWVWQLGPLVMAGAPTSSDPYRRTITFQLGDDDKWSEQCPDPISPASIRAGVTSPDKAMIALMWSLTNGLMTADNKAERLVVMSLAGLLLELFGQAKDNDTVITFADVVAPLGQKKMLLVLPPDENAEIGPATDLPGLPRVSSWERHRILGALASKLAADGATPGPPGTAQEQSALINKAVEFFYSTLRNEAHDLDPAGLMERLLGHTEAALRELALSRIQIPTRVACFGAYSDIVGKLQGETRELATASIANRILVEFLAAEPASGAKPLTRSRYVRLLTLAAMIVSFGFQSDVALYQLATTDVHILPNGWIAAFSTDFEAGMGRYMGQAIPSHIRNAQRTFASHWTPTAGPGAPPADLDAAFAAEFGYDLNTMALVLQALADTTSSTQSVATKARQDIGAAAVAKGVAQADVERVLGDIVLEPRPSYLAPPAPFTKTDVWPWLFNRRLSLIRRPVVARGQELVFGFRGLLGAARQVLMLVSEGRLPFPASKEMKDFQAKFSQEASDDFVDRVATMLTGAGYDTKKKVERFGPFKLESVPGQTLGDVDVLAVDVPNKILWAIECKNIAFAKTPRELFSELRELEEPTHGLVVKHKRRAAWMEAHLTDVVTGLSLPDAGWRVIAVMTVSEPLPTPHIRQLELPVIPADELPTWMSGRAGAQAVRRGLGKPVGKVKGGKSRKIPAHLRGSRRKRR